MTADLESAVYAAACLSPVNTEDRRFVKIMHYNLAETGYKGEESDKAGYKKILAKLVQAGALLDTGMDYVRAATAKKDQLQVRARLGAKVKQFNGFEYETYVPVTLYVADDKGLEYDLKAPSDLTLVPDDVVEVILSPDKKLAYAQSIVSARRFVLGTASIMSRKSRSTSNTLYTEDYALKPYTMTFAEGGVGEAKSGQVVVCEIVGRGPGKKLLIKTKEVIRSLGKLDYVILRAVIEHNIPNAWPQNMPRALAQVPDTVRKSDMKGRRDLRELPLVTIDGEDARDFDDAVCVIKEGKNFRLYVAIADVSYYVRPGTILDKEAQQRCNSVYFPNFVIPMLPEKLSNGICSLNPEVERLCMVCEMEISKQGKTTKYEFYPAVMRSHARLTYTEAWSMIQTHHATRPEHENVVSEVLALHELYKVLKKARQQRGGFEVESQEVHFIFNEKLQLKGLTPVVRNDAHKLIEECMIAANVAAATFVAESKSRTLFRVHASPSQEKLDMLHGALLPFGMTLGGADSPTPIDYYKFCEQIKGRPDESILGELLLRSMSKAEYSPDNIGHFGLALEKYAHFTSPIRRYADLQLHRVIKYLLEKQHPDFAWGKIGARSYTGPELASLGMRCTEREIEADHAEMDVDTTLKCTLVAKHVGQVTQGTVSAVKPFGAFIHLNDFMVDGMMFIGNISDSFVTFNEKTQTLSSADGVIKTGDQLKVRISSVDVMTRKIDLLPVYPEEEAYGDAELQVDRSRIFVEDDGKRPEVEIPVLDLLHSVTASEPEAKPAAETAPAEEAEKKQEQPQKQPETKAEQAAEGAGADQATGKKSRSKKAKAKAAQAEQSVQSAEATAPTVQEVAPAAKTAESTEPAAPARAAGGKKKKGQTAQEAAVTAPVAEPAEAKAESAPEAAPAEQGTEGKSRRRKNKKARAEAAQAAAAAEAEVSTQDTEEASEAEIAESASAQPEELDLTGHVTLGDLIKAGYTRAPDFEAIDGAAGQGGSGGRSSRSKKRRKSRKHR